MRLLKIVKTNPFQSTLPPPPPRGFFYKKGGFKKKGGRKKTQGGGGRVKKKTIHLSCYMVGKVVLGPYTGMVKIGSCRFG